MESKVIKVFVSYAHKSAKDKESFMKKMMIFEKQGYVVFWAADEQLCAGEKFDPIIKKNLDESDIGVILMDDNSISNSDYIRDIEIPMIFKKEVSGEMWQFPILVEECHWDLYNVNGYTFNETNLIPKKNTQLTAVKKFKTQRDGWFAVSTEFKLLIQRQTFKNFFTNKYQHTNFIFDQNNIPNIEENYIHREELENVLQTWYSQGNQPICYIKGFAGIGKTTFARYMAKQIQEEENDFVIWVESAEWEGYKSIDTIIKKYFKREDGQELNTIDHFLKNLDKKILIILDGVNEKGANSTLEYLLRDLSLHHSSIMDKKNNEVEKYDALKLILITRDVNAELDERIYKVIELMPFEDMTRLLPQTETEETANLANKFKTIIHNPRYIESILDVVSSVVPGMSIISPLIKSFRDEILKKDALSKNDLFSLELFDLINKESDVDLAKSLIEYFKDNASSLKSSLETDIDIIKDIGLQDCKSQEDFTQVIYVSAIFIIKKYKKVDGQEVSLQELINTINEEVLEQFKSYGDDFLAKVPYAAFKLSIEKFPTAHNTSHFHAALLYIWIKNHNTHYTQEDMEY
jgi:adenylate kinase family enzyme